MKKSILTLAVASAMGVGSAQAAFLQAGSTGTIDLNAGCFTFGDCAIGGLGDVTDNAITVRGAGTGVAADGLVGQISFTVGANGNDLTINSFQQDSYTATSGGDFALNTTASTSSGFISDAGDLSLTLQRNGFPNFFSYLDNAIWNVDDSATIAGQGDATSGSLDSWTTGSDSNWTPGTPGTAAASGSGSGPLTAGGVGTWTGSVVNYGNVGAAWAAFDGTPYTEKFNITLNGVEDTGGGTDPIPVPAAVWLFGSGLVGLVGVARRRKKA